MLLAVLSSMLLSFSLDHLPFYCISTLLSIFTPSMMWVPWKQLHYWISCFQNGAHITEVPTEHLLREWMLGPLPRHLVIASLDVLRSFSSALINYGSIFDYAEYWALLFVGTVSKKWDFMVSNYQRQQLTTDSTAWVVFTM
jgi:hypothetical protein